MLPVQVINAKFGRKPVSCQTNAKKQSTAIRDKSGKLIPDPAAQKERWKEHFSELLNPLLDNVDLSDLDRIAPQPCFSYLEADDVPSPYTAEISCALKRLKNYKSPGVDEISNEQLKYGEAGISGQLEMLYSVIWQQEKLPEDWSKGIIIVIGKKGDTSDCPNNRGITLRSTASKVLQMIIFQRMHDGMEELLRENQCGFRRNRSCIDQIFTLRSMIHNCIEYNIPLYANFIDFKAAFDSIRCSFI